jgi:glycosyltransferase involved in cell wall biosynthesis
MKMQKLNMACPIGVTGYGITSFNIYKSLRKNTDITLFPMGSPTLETTEFKDELSNDIGKQNVFSKTDPFFKIWHQFDLANRIGIGKYTALTFFETDKLKPHEIQMINNTDTIVVASKWAKQILIDNGVKIPIAVCPLGIDPNIFNESVINTVKKDYNKYVFLNVGKWEIRKGHDILVDIFNDAFTEDDNVELWMVNHNPFLSPQENNTWINLYKNSKLGKKIQIIPRLPKHSDVAQVIAMSDCGIFPARAEGWNNEIPEFFALNKPVILTNYSAHTEYSNKDNSILLEVDGLTQAKDDRFFDGYGNWADLSDKFYDQAVESMRYVYKNNIRTNPNGLITAKNLTWDNTANIIYNTIYG